MATIRETSLLAYESIKDRILSLQEQIYILIRKKNGLTCDEIEQLLNIPHQTASARIVDLQKGYRIEDKGERRLTRSNRQAIVWKSK